MSITKGSAAISAIELLSLAGFSLCMAWTFVTFFWLFCDFPVGVPVGVRDLSQVAVFAGLPAGYVLLSFLGRDERFSPFAPVLLLAACACGLLLPLAALLMRNGVFVPLAVVCACGALCGVAGAWFMVTWLDVLSRLRTTHYGRFTGLGFIGGVVLFGLAATAADAMQPVFSVAYLIGSIGLLAFATRNADANEERAPLEAVGQEWRFTKEIEPSFFMFGAVFALNFVFLFNNGQGAVLAGILSVIPGALAIVVASLAGRELNITLVQRILLVVTVLGCVLLPFSAGYVQLACACLTMAAWALFRAANYAFVVKKSVLRRAIPFFRQAPLRLCVSTLGFGVGWAVAAAITWAWGPHAELFTAVRLVSAFLLVGVVMAFFPIGRHHPYDGMEAAEEGQGAAVAVSMDETELFERRCAAIAKLYQLSPRETDILAYLARGRNAAWIQDELTISPHTVKSHIYNIYRKLDIHSQQKLMSFVEDYPLDMER